MGDYRGGSMIGGLPVVTGKAKTNTLPKFLGGSMVDSKISDDGALVTVASPMTLSGLLNISGQIKSLLTGVAPMTVASSIVVSGFNSDLLDGYQASLTAVANTIPVYNASAQLVGSITGNAATATTATSATSATSAATLTTARTISLSGDVTGSISFNGSANVAIASTLANSGVTAGTYRSVTVDGKGRVTGGTNPTTLAGYGITDAVAANAAFIELRSGAVTAGPAYFDFHTSGNQTDFDTRIIADGGTTTAGQGRLVFSGDNGYFDMNQVQFRDRVWVRPATGYGTVPALHLSIGDSDTGFNWIYDGGLDWYSNATVAMRVSDGWAYFRNINGVMTSMATLRPTTISTAAPSGGQDGDVWLQY